MAYKKVNNLTLQDARIIFRNFAGKASKFNNAGNRNFCVVIEDPEQAQALIDEGWNVKQFRPRDDDEEEPAHYISVAVNFEHNPPSVYLLTGNRRTVLTEDTIDTLDHADFRTADLIIRPYCWDVGDKSGIKAYLKTMYVKVEEDELAKKYAAYDDCEDCKIVDAEDEDFPF